MSKKAICIQSSLKYFEQSKHAILSAKKYNPDHKIVLLTDDVQTNLVDFTIHPEDLSLNRSEPNNTGGFIWLVAGRPAIIRYTLQNLNFDSCIFIDGDTYTYNSYEELQNLLDDEASLVVTPHILEPLPNDNLFPSINDICLMGNYNSGVFGASKKAIEFINWWENQTKKYPLMQKSIGIAAEQGWLRFAADFNKNTKIFTNKGYNVAYWNIAQRNINLKNNIFYADNDKLTIMHFSGLTKETKPENMSHYQNRYKLKEEGVIYKIFQDYKKLVWS